MENQIFSLGRFTAYLKKYLSENRSIRLQFIILTGVFSALLAISGGSMNFFNLTAAMFIFAIIGIFLGVLFVNNIKDNQKEQISTYVNDYITKNQVPQE